jgi:putative transposase
MPQSLANIFIHLVFSTKNREQTIVLAVEPELHAYMATIFNENGCHAILINGTTDHAHALFNLSRTITIAEIVNAVKSNSSKWMKTKSASFNWQGGYGAFSVGQSDLERVKGYIAKQKIHHQKQTFQDEFRDMLKRAGIEHDERYVWD